MRVKPAETRLRMSMLEAMVSGLCFSLRTGVTRQQEIRRQRLSTSRIAPTVRPLDDCKVALESVDRTHSRPRPCRNCSQAVALTISRGLSVFVGNLPCRVVETQRLCQINQQRPSRASFSSHLWDKGKAVLSRLRDTVCATRRWYRACIVKNYQIERSTKEDDTISL